MSKPGYKIQTYSSAEAVRAHYPQLLTERPFDNWACKVKWFGNPTLPGWEQENIVPVEIVGCGPDRSKTQGVRLHKSLAPLVEQIFREIRDADLDYSLLTFHDYSFRYVVDSLPKAWLESDQYQGISRKNSHITFAQEDLRLGRFEEIGPGWTRPRREKLSNHASGTALDINAGTNGLGNDTVCDIHPFIVDLFQRKGFFWGGFYTKRRDYMHFEYMLEQLPSVGEMPRVFHFPIVLGDGRNASAYYRNNEATSIAEVEEPLEIPSTEGGFFPLALPNGGKCGLHGGIHLASDSDGAEVRCMAPGVVVAARLAPLEHGQTNATVGQSLRNWNNFVLVRHEFQPKDLEGKSLYSLYMHLAPVRFPEEEEAFAAKLAPVDGDLGKIPWLRRVFLGRHGLLVKVRPGGTGETGEIPVGASFWCARPLEIADGKPSDFQTDVLTLDGASGRRVALRGEPDATGASESWWEFKPPPMDVAAVWEDLKKGKVVTFGSRPMPLQSGECLGITTRCPFQGSVVRDGDAPSFKVNGRYLHWEVFAPEQEGSIEALVDELKKIATENAESLITSVVARTPGEAWTGSQIREKLAGSNAPVGLGDLADDPTAFDVVWLFEAEIRKDALIHVTLNLRDLVPPSKRASSVEECAFRLSWIGGPKGKKVVHGLPFSLRLGDSQARLDWIRNFDFTVVPPKLPDPVQLSSRHWNGDEPLEFLLPASMGADTLRVEWFDPRLLIQPPDHRKLEVDWRYFRALTGISWRNVRLVHASDWLPESNESQLGDGVGEASPAGALAWWDPNCEAPAYGGKSIFGSLLPGDGVVECMHPVTLKWVLELVRNFGKGMSPLFREIPSSGGAVSGSTGTDANPIGVGFLVEGNQAGFGSTVAVACAHGEYFLGGVPTNSVNQAVVIARQPSGGGSSPAGGARASIPSDPSAAPSSTSLRDAGRDLARDAMVDLAASAQEEATDLLAGQSDESPVAPLSIPSKIRIPLSFSEVGVQVAPWVVGVWGKWKVGAERDDNPSDTQAWGAEEIDVPPPRFGPANSAMAPAPQSESDQWDWCVPWEGEPLGKPMKALVELVFLQSGGRISSGLAVVGLVEIPPEPDPLLADPETLAMDGPYILGAKIPEGSRSAPDIKLMDRIQTSTLGKLKKFVKVHRRLVRALGTMGRQLDYLAIQSISADGLSAKVSGRAKSVKAYTESRLFSSVVWNLSTNTGTVAIDPDENPRLRCTFDARALVSKAFGEDRPDMVGADYAFDLHLVQGFSEENPDTGKFYRLPETRSPDDFASYSFPLKCGSFPAAGFGAARATMQAQVPPPETPEAASSLVWTFEVELVGDPEPWTKLTVEAVVSRGLEKSQPVSADLVDGKAVFSLSVAESADRGDFLRTGEHAIALTIRGKVETAKGKAKKGALALAASALKQIGGSFELSSETTTRHVDLTPRLSEGSVSTESGITCVRIRTAGLASSLWMDHRSSWRIPSTLSGACKLELRDSFGDPLPGGDPGEGCVVFPDPDGMIRLDIPPRFLLAPDGFHRLRIAPIEGSVRGVPISPLVIPLEVETAASP
ncbi:MAG: M15 family metallopeptidase [Fibrobacteria bacterium]|nr:M15 family metallopeptidase [Fibrobacteria bacterium]